MSITVDCSYCGKPLVEMPLHSPDDLQQWFGRVCEHCGQVFCSECISLNTSSPCPNCGGPTDPAQIYYLHKIGIR
jgi:hypothetical protein